MGMALSVVEICNLALARIGSGTVIESLADDDSQEAIACNAVYVAMRDAVLRDFPWPMANTIADLGLIETDPNDEWGYSYQYPSDCIRALRIVGAGRSPEESTRIAYDLGASDTGRLIYTDEADAQLQYTKRITDPNHFDASFASVLAWRIAEEIGAPLAKSASLVERAGNKYKEELATARATAVNETVADEPFPDASWIQARE